MKTILKRVGMPLVIGLLLGSHAHADIGVERRSAVVNIAGFDLSTEVGRDRVYRKLKTAAKQVCVDVDSRRNLARSMLFSQCVNDALTEAVFQVSDPVFRRHAVQRLGIAEPALTTASRDLR